MTITEETLVRITRGYRLQWEEAQQCHVLLYPEGMVKLNIAAGEILKRCDGVNTVAGILADLKSKFPDVDVRDDVFSFLRTAQANGWIGLT